MPHWKQDMFLQDNRIKVASGTSMQGSKERYKLKYAAIPAQQAVGELCILCHFDPREKS